VVVAGNAAALLLIVGVVLTAWLTRRLAESNPSPMPPPLANKLKSQAVLALTLPRSTLPPARMVVHKDPTPAPPARSVPPAFPPPPAAERAERPGEALLARAFRPPELLARREVAPRPDPAGNYGTCVHFLDSPAAADRLADKTDKLRFVLHVSGNFEDPGCT
jgi:hypothetical protein